jgi:DNA-binding response OmpR family regulator
VTASLLFIDDDRAVVHELPLFFLQEGYHVDHALPGLEAIRKLLINEPDLVILGVDCKRGDWQFCRRLLAFLDKPLLLLLSTKNTLDLVKGLELGCADCMIKPALPMEVMARVRALLRRSDSQACPSVRSFFADEGLVVDLTRREIWLDGQSVALTPTEFRLLWCFVQHPGEVVTHERLAIHLWGGSHPGAHNCIKQYVHQLRRKLESNPSHPLRIVTRRGEGYLFRSLADR